MNHPISRGSGLTAAALFLTPISIAPQPAREDGSWLVDGTVAVEELEGAIAFRAPSASTGGTYRTVGGLVMTQLQRIPKRGDHFAVNGFRFEVVDMDGRRIDMIMVSRLPD